MAAPNDILGRLAGFGLFQKRIIAVILFASFLAGPTSFVSSVFAVYTPPHRCYVQELDGQETSSRKTTKLLSPTDSNVSDIISRYIPTENGADDELRWSQCYMYNNTYTDNSTANNTIKCNEGWRYFEEPGEFTASMEFDLVCDKAWVVPLVASFMMFGLMLGSITGGYVSDRFGRKTASLTGMVALTVSTLLISFTPVWIGIHLMTLVQEFANIIRMASGIVLLNEVCPNKYRHRISVSNILLSSVGSAFLPLFAFCFRNWRYMTGALGIVQLFALLPAIFILEESLKWLSQKGKEKQLKKILYKAAELNKIDLKKTDMTELKKEPSQNSDKSGEKDTNKEKLSYLHLIKIPFLRKRIIIFSLAWLSLSSSFYGLSLNANNLKGNRYLVFLCVSGAETPGHILSMLTIQKLGCRLTFVIFNTITGVVLLITPILQSVNNVAVIACNVVGKLFSSGCFVATVRVHRRPFPNTSQESVIWRLLICGKNFWRIGSFCDIFRHHCA
ncbi:solute carrier family 22 member 19-like [Clavelina lepadiformis]|uniref:solute carrier family 22 member 19-like n=1 Tax=Clavelina lepadiformis TaxID=159417 RepID=UPI0040433B5B